ncbi:response regulator [Stenotrophobium rhamnosiphilum]|uniref:DNA-binding response regulator n=1 Tax=Stenotrophobium rhamnosiphilum TaxID=2029166 RepID=A0A2T5MDD5_9GAMM|nr:response regulator transcription factor [Stenotrophobium rhamnosiphilum]PTU30585.1 DNA-binding response regulator [Stenotrophobium rhamnosiphilum]
MKIILADQQTLMRAAVRCLIETMHGMKVIAETGDGQELLKLVARHRPDIVITDMDLASMSGLDCTEQINRHYPASAVLVLSDQTAMQPVRAALKAGIASFVAKDAERQELELALRATARGQSYFSPKVSRSALEQRRLQRGEDRPSLTVRQRQIMQLLARGSTTKEIAGIMGVGIKTVETHRARAMEALHLKTSNALIHYAIRHGFDGSNPVTSFPTPSA